MIHAFVFSDIVGSSEKWGRYRDSFAPTVSKHLDDCSRLSAQQRAVSLKLLGDGAMAVFTSPVNAISYAIDLQRSVASTDWSKLTPGLDEFRVRVGIHCGQSIEFAAERDFYGPAVNKAGRLCSSGDGGQILMSDVTQALVRSDLGSEMQLIDGGRKTLRGVGTDRVWQLIHPDFNSPRVSRSGSSFTNINQRRSHVIGRDREVARILRSVTGEERSSVLLVGPGGVGKTALAIEVASASHRSFSDGVWFVSCEGVQSKQDAIDEICRTLRPAGFSGSGEEDLLGFLKSVALMLVIDGADRLMSAEELLEDVLSTGPGICLLITSRSRLNISRVEVLEVEPMSLDDAVELFFQRARTAGGQPGTGAEMLSTVRQLCEQLDRLPLAIELAASRTIDFTPAELLERIEDRLSWLTSEKSTDAREASLRATLSWSIEDLSPSNRVALFACSLFRRPFTAEDVESFDDIGDAMAAISALRRRSLLARSVVRDSTESMYSLLDTTADYTRELLSSQRQLRDRLEKAWITRIARSLGPLLADLRTSREAESLDTFGTNAEDVVAALDAMSRMHDHEFGPTLALIRARFLNMQGRFAEAADFLESHVPRLSGSGDDDAYCDLILLWCAVLIDLRMLDEAKAVLDSAEQLVDQTDKPLIVGARIHNLKGLIAYHQGDYEGARRQLQTAAAGFARGQDEIGTSTVTHNFGLVEYSGSDGDRDRALECWLEALTARRRIGDRRGMAETLTNLGVLELDMGDLALSWEHQSEALSIEHSLDHQAGIARCLFNLAEVAEQSQQLEMAARLCKSSQAIFEAVKSPLQNAASAYYASLAEQVGEPEPPPHLVSLPIIEILQWAMEARLASLPPQGTR